MSYSIDTSALLDGWTRYYPPDVFPTLWSQLDQLAAAQILMAADEVLQELQKKDDGIYQWAKTHAGMFIPIDEPIQVEVASLLNTYPRLVDNRRNRSQADPFVIAVARCRGCIVVTGEKPSNSLDKPRIPDVCSAVGIECIDLLGLFRREGWHV